MFKKQHIKWIVLILFSIKNNFYFGLEANQDDEITEKIESKSQNPQDPNEDENVNDQEDINKDDDQENLEQDNKNQENPQEEDESEETGDKRDEDEEDDDEDDDDVDVSNIEKFIFVTLGMIIMTAINLAYNKWINNSSSLDNQQLINQSKDNQKIKIVQYDNEFQKQDNQILKTLQEKLASRKDVFILKLKDLVELSKESEIKQSEIQELEAQKKIDSGNADTDKKKDEKLEKPDEAQQKKKVEEMNKKIELANGIVETLCLKDSGRDITVPDLNTYINFFEYAKTLDEENRKSFFTNQHHNTQSLLNDIKEIIDYNRLLKGFAPENGKQESKNGQAPKKEAAKNVLKEAESELAGKHEEAALKKPDEVETFNLLDVNIDKSKLSSALEVVCNNLINLKKTLMEYSVNPLFLITDMFLENVKAYIKQNHSKIPEILISIYATKIISDDNGYILSNPFFFEFEKQSYEENEEHGNNNGELLEKLSEDVNILHLFNSYKPIIEMFLNTSDLSDMIEIEKNINFIMLNSNSFDQSYKQYKEYKQVKDSKNNELLIQNFSLDKIKYIFQSIRTINDNSFFYETQQEKIITQMNIRKIFCEELLTLLNKKDESKLKKNEEKIDLSASHQPILSFKEMLENLIKIYTYDEKKFSDLQEHQKQNSHIDRDGRLCINNLYSSLLRYYRQKIENYQKTIDENFLDKNLIEVSALDQFQISEKGKKIMTQLKENKELYDLFESLKEANIFDSLFNADPDLMLNNTYFLSYILLHTNEMKPSQVKEFKSRSQTDDQYQISTKEKDLIMRNLTLKIEIATKKIASYKPLLLQKTEDITGLKQQINDSLQPSIQAIQDQQKKLKEEKVNLQQLLPSLLTEQYSQPTPEQRKQQQQQQQKEERETNIYSIKSLINREYEHQKNILNSMLSNGEKLTSKATLIDYYKEKLNLEIAMFKLSQIDSIYEDSNDHDENDEDMVSDTIMIAIEQ